MDAFTVTLLVLPLSDTVFVTGVQLIAPNIALSSNRKPVEGEGQEMTLQTQPSARSSFIGNTGGYISRPTLGPADTRTTPSQFAAAHTRFISRRTRGDILGWCSER